MTTAAEAVALRFDADAAVAEAAEALSGGATRLRTPRFPFSYDLNAVWAPVGADQATVDALAAAADRRVWLPEPAADVVAPAGWQAAEERIMTPTAARPAWPATARRVPAAVLNEARGRRWRAWEPEHADGLVAMTVALDARPDVQTLAVLSDGAPAAWCTVQAGAIDDVWTEPAFRRRGHARAIVRAALAAGATHLCVDPANTPAVGLYASEGLVERARLVGLLRG